MGLRSDITDRLEMQFSESKIDVEVDGNHASLRIVSEQFDSLSPVKRQQLVYACLNDLIQSGDLHAVSIQAKSPKET